MGVTLGSTVLVALSAGELVTVWLNFTGVELSPGKEVFPTGVGVGEMGGKSAGVAARVVVGSSVCPAQRVS